MHTLRAKVDLPWMEKKQGDEWPVPSLIGIPTHMKTLGQVEVVSDDEAKPKRKRAKRKTEAKPGAETAEPKPEE